MVKAELAITATHKGFGRSLCTLDSNSSDISNLLSAFTAVLGKLISFKVTYIFMANGKNNHRGASLLAKIQC